VSQAPAASGAGDLIDDASADSKQRNRLLHPDFARAAKLSGPMRGRENAQGKAMAV
jgi:hypothetical protein